MINITYKQAFNVLKKTLEDFQQANDEARILPQTNKDQLNLAYLNGVNSCVHFTLMMIEDLEKLTK